MSESKYTFGMFVWRELYTSDIEASKRFYGELAGWSLRKAAMPGMDYWLASVNGREIAGLFQPPGGPSHWNAYVSVPDVDASAAAATARGGAVIHGPLDIPGVGRMATIRDPQGAVVSVLKNATGDGATGAMPQAGEFCWEQLNTTDVAAAKAFYPAVVGWKVQSFNGMEVFGMHDGPSGNAASFMQAPPGQPAHWLSYLVVPRLADANARAARLGARVLMERIEVPTIGSFSVLQDNAGALVSLFEGLAPAT